MSKGKPDQNASLLREYVYRALCGKAKGTDATSYANLVKEIATLRKKTERDANETTTHLLANMIHAVKDCVSSLRERKHDALLNDVLGIKLWSCPPIIRDAVLELVGNLVVANAAFTHTCLQLLVYSFLPPPAPPATDVDQNEWKMPEEAAMVQAAVLSTLEKVMQMVPTAPTKLLQLITQHMPHKLRDRSTQCLYLTAVFGIAERRAGAPIRDGLFAAVVEHLLSIDVEIRWEDIVEAPTGQEEEEQGASEDEEDAEDIFELEGMSELDINATPEQVRRRQRELAAAAADRGGWEGAAASAVAVASSSGRPAVDETANKLDSLMELTFEHMARRLQAGQTTDLWASLLSIFERAILSTNRSKFTQYLVFYMCKQHPQACAPALVDLLLTKLQDARQPSITRCACAAYIASFLARAAFVPRATVVAALQRLVAFCHKYAQSVAAGNSTAQPGLHHQGSGLQRAQSNGAVLDAAANSMVAQHQVFYASMQSALYILCYHLRALMGAPSRDGVNHAAVVRQLVREQLVPLMQHKQLDPLAVCLPSVVLEFKQQAASLDLLSLSMFDAVGDHGKRAQRPLEMFFPFDPYLLKRSSKCLLLNESYVRWRHGHPSMRSSAAAAALRGASDADEDDVSEEELSEAEEEDEEEAGAMDDASDDDSSGDELEGMSLPDDPSILARPGVGAALGRPPLGKTLRTMTEPPAALGLQRGVASKPKQYGHDDMAVSYSPGGVQYSTGDVTPTGTSPVLVNYMSPCGGSPMQMTPVFHHHMEGVPHRLAHG